MENNTCLKPPTSYSIHGPLINQRSHHWWAPHCTTDSRTWPQGSPPLLLPAIPLRPGTIWHQSRGCASFISD